MTANAAKSGNSAEGTICLYKLEPVKARHVTKACSLPDDYAIATVADCIQVHSHIEILGKNKPLLNENKSNV